MMAKLKSTPTRPAAARARHHIAESTFCHDHDPPVIATRHLLELGVRPEALDHLIAVTQHHQEQNGKEKEDANGADIAQRRSSQKAGLMNELE